MIALILEMRKLMLKPRRDLGDLLKVTPILSGRVRIYTEACLASFPLCLCMLGLQRITGVSCVLSAPFTAIHSTIHLLKLGSPPPHKEARQSRRERRKKLLAEQEQLERQMKELQAANENKQRELETVRKVRRGERTLGRARRALCIAGATAASLPSFDFTKTRLLQFWGDFFGELCTQEVYLHPQDTLVSPA